MSSQMKPRAKKHLGQHFLRDTGVLERISRLIQAGSGDLVLEIGAGDGALSRRLAPTASRLLALEVDAECIAPLEAALAPFPSATVVPCDVMEADIAALVSPYLAHTKRLRIAGNLPYNLATAIIEKALRLPLRVSDLVFMVQLEVAQRITAVPGTRQYGYFSVLCRHFAEVALAFRVRPECFSPRPRVFSAIVQLRPYNLPTDRRLDGAFARIAKAAFAYRRKMLSNALPRDAVIGANTGKLLSCAEIDGSRRAEQLSVREYEELARCFLNLSGGQAP